jgi:tRNA(Arg) A34 adenosine deaminase TadA
MKHEDLMQLAVALSEEGLLKKEGGPFGAVVVRDGKVVGRGNNRVTSTNDPTAHAEIEAIRDACKQLNTFQLTDCVIYTSCEPCPMCLGAIYWARPKAVYYANTRLDAAAIGFDDALIYNEIPLQPEQRIIPMHHLPLAAAAETFRKWTALEGKIAY